MGNTSDDAITDYRRVMEEVLWHLDAQVDKGGWDQPSQLLIIQREDESNGQEKTAFVMMSGFPGWEYLVERLGGPRQALEWLDDYLDDPLHPRPKPPRDLYGLALLTEARMVDTSVSRPGAAFFAQGTADGLTPSQHPDRVEIRHILLQPVVGEGMALAHERDGIARVWGNEETATGGAVPELLESILGKLIR